jgi:hypothetical protein
LTWRVFAGRLRNLWGCPSDDSWMTHYLDSGNLFWR